MIIAGLFIAQTALACWCIFKLSARATKASRSVEFWSRVGVEQARLAQRNYLAKVALEDENIILRARLSRPKLAELNRTRSRK